MVMMPFGYSGGKLMRFIKTLPLLLLIAACAPIQHSADVAQPIGRQLAAGPGDVIMHVDLQRNLVNVFGGADIWGRRTNEGFADLYFSGVEPDGTIVLYRKGASIITNETTLSRMPFTQSVSTVSGNVTNYGNTTSVSGVGTTTTIRPTHDYHIIVPADAIAIRLPPGTTSVPFEGYMIQIVNSSPTALTYRIAAQ